MNETYEAKAERMKKYLNKVKRCVKIFKEASFIQIPRKENMEANALVKEVSVSESMDKFNKIQYMPSIGLLEV